MQMLSSSISVMFVVVDTCQGDSGGPLMMFTTSSQWVIVGLTSYGIGCANASYAGVYTRVAYYQSWIATKMSAYGSSYINPILSWYTVGSSISGCSSTTTLTSTTQIMSSVTSSAIMSGEHEWIFVSVL